MKRGHFAREFSVEKQTLINQKGDVSRYEAEQEKMSGMFCRNTQDKQKVGRTGVGEELKGLRPPEISWPMVMSLDFILPAPGSDW